MYTIKDSRTDTKIHKPLSIGITERGDAGLDFSWQNNKTVSGLILITKRLSHEFIQKAAEINCIVHATITGNGGTKLEPGVIPFSESKKLFRELIATIGESRVVLRIDPIIPTTTGVNRAVRVYQELHENLKTKTRVRISFLDNYPHVKARFEDAGIPALPYQFHAPLQQRKEIARLFPDAEICGEPGFNCTGCISDSDLKTLNLSTDAAPGGHQRRDCACLAAKTELLKTRGRCPHGCLYCYWK